MAACSELELDGKSSQEKRLLCSKSLDSTTNKEDAFNTQKACNSEMSGAIVSAEDSKNTVDIGSLTEEQLQSLLEEATTFNRPKDEASSILRALRKQIKDSDDVKETVPDVSTTSASCVPAASIVASHSNISSKRKNRNPGNVSNHRGRLLHGSDDTLMVDYSNFIQLSSKNSETTFGAGAGGRHCIVNLGREPSRELQSQSLQDLASARFSDTHDSMRAAGIGRGNRRLQKAGRANSFTEHTSEWTGLGAQISTLDRTQGRALKPTKPRASASNRSSWTGQMVVNVADAENGNPVGVSPSAVKLPTDPYALFNDCEYDMNSGDSISSKLWSGRSSDSSSPDKEDSQLDTIPNSPCDTNDSGVSLLSCRPLNDEFYPAVTCSEYGSVDLLKRRSSPNEVEMIDMSKTATFGDVGECGPLLFCKQDGFSDVDAPVLFPLKSASIGHNNINCTTRSGPVNGIYEFQDRYRSVQSIISPGDDIKKEDFKILDMRTAVPFFNHLSTSGGYGYDGGPNKNDMTNAHVRKIKRSKSNAETGIKRAEDCDGYRGKEDIDTLLEFINSTDKNKTNQNQSTNNNTGFTPSTTISTNNNNNNNNNNNGNNNYIATINPYLPATTTSTIGGNHTTKCKGNVSVTTVTQSIVTRSLGNSLDSDRKSSASSKDKCSRHLKKKINSLEGADDEMGDETPQQLNSNLNVDSDTEHGDEPQAILPSRNMREAVNLNGPFEKRCEMEFAEKGPPFPIVSDTFPTSSLRSSSIAQQNEKLVSSFAKDFYSVTEVSSQLIEESEFRVVVNKQRKRKQAKKPDSFRRYGNTCSNVPPGVGSGGSTERDYYLQESPCHHSMLLSGLPLSHRSQRGQSEFSRRKSTSSMPPSEASSADNSDLDSVHSLPVSGTAPPPTRPHPHTTPSSMSSTPQASYADIARMSTQMTLAKGKGQDVTSSANNSVHNSTSVSPNPPPSSSSSHSLPSTTSATTQKSSQDVLDLSTGSSVSKESEFSEPDERNVSRTNEHDKSQSATLTFPESSPSLVSTVDTPSTSGPRTSTASSERTTSPSLSSSLDEKCSVGAGSVIQEVPHSTEKAISTCPLVEHAGSNLVTKTSNNTTCMKTGSVASNAAAVKPNSPPAPAKQNNSSTTSLNTKHNSSSNVVAHKHSNSSNATVVASSSKSSTVVASISKQNAPVTPFAKPTSSSAQGPRFLQESTVLYQSQNISAKPSFHKSESAVDQHAPEHSTVSRTKLPLACSEGIVRKTVPPVIKMEKDSSTGATSPPPPPPPSCLSDISFGVDMSEILQLGDQGGQINPVTFEFEQCSHHLQSDNVSSKAVLCAEAQPGTTCGSSSAASSSRGSVETTTANVCVGGHVDESSLEDKSSGSVVVVRGKRLQWKENDAEIKNFNHSQVVSFFGTAWDSVLHDFEKDSTEEGKKSGKVCYYSSYC